MKKHLTLYFLLQLCFCALNGQNAKLDSLITSLSKNSVNDTNKVKTTNAICWEYFITGDFKESKKYADQSIELANKLNFLKGKAEAINYLGNIHAQKAEYYDA